MPAQDTPQGAVPDPAEARDGAPARAGLASFVGRVPPWLARALRTGFVVVVFVLVARTLVVEWPRVRVAASRLDAGALLAATAFGLVSLVALWRSWHALLVGAGVTLPPRASALVFYVGQLGKYAPGGVWTIVAQTELAAGRKVPRSVGAVVGTASIVVVAGTGAATGSLAVLRSEGALEEYGWTLLVLAVCALALVPRVLNALVAVALRVVAPRTGAVAFGGSAILRSLSWCLVWWALTGLHGWFLVRGIAPEPDAAAVVGAFALAWVVGLVVVIAPAGVGAREGALVLLLAGVLDVPDALVVALVSRVIFMVADLATAGGAAALVRLGRRPDGAARAPR